jgi:type VI protein secretion system component Hcp
MNRFYLFAIMSVLLLAGNVALAAGFIKFDGVDGESQAKGFEGQSDVLGYDWGMSIPLRANGSGRRRAAVELEELIFSKAFDTASVALQDRLASGFITRRVVLTLVDNGEDGQREPYLQYELGNVQLSSYRVSWNDTGKPVEHYGIVFETILLSYTTREDDGAAGDTLEWSYDARRGR